MRTERTSWAGFTGAAYFRTNDETGRFKGCRRFSYQSPMPVGTGTPRYEKWAALVGGRVLMVFVPPLRPLDSGPVSGYGACFRRKDEVGEATYGARRKQLRVGGDRLSRIRVRDMLS